MFCQNCGAYNEDDAKFCGSCGSELEGIPPMDNDDFEDTQILDSNLNYSQSNNQEQTYNNNFNNNQSYTNEGNYRSNYNYNNQDYRNDWDYRETDDGRKKKIIIGIIVGLLTLVVLVSIFLILKRKKDNEDYFKGENSYNSSQSSDNDNNNYGEDLDYEEDYSDVLADASREVGKGNYKEAVDLYESIPSYSEDYYRAQDEIKALEDKMVTGLQRKFEEADYEGVNEDANSYLEVFPESAKIWEMKSKAQNEIAYNDKVQLEEEIERQKQESDSNYYGYDDYEDYYDYEDYEDYDYYEYPDPVYFNVQASTGNVREAPDINSNVVDKVYKGEEVLVYSLYYDGERIWCELDYGWISAKLLTGEY
ncbi:zinc-ribbon domain-containing protein [Peptoniphilus catoniae]|uniref:zinc-ribbon domain-containing protein n=1 Tax=Peptoniphilus catoniae TaxID=1660341 RepID=UPI0010FD61A2|nr:zinc-ribbon domain-containing protein [Peptoniphilus catoniae]